MQPQLPKLIELLARFSQTTAIRPFATFGARVPKSHVNRHRRWAVAVEYPLPRRGQNSSPLPSEVWPLAQGARVARPLAT
jgi:hypothetical protein